MAVAHDALPADLGLQIAMLGEEVGNLGFDGLHQQSIRRQRHPSDRQEFECRMAKFALFLVSALASHRLYSRSQAICYLVASITIDSSRRKPGGMRVSFSKLRRHSTELS
jgi:hypothetical protein